MSQSIDISLIPIALRPSQVEQELNCLFAAHPPRSTARGRDADRLIFYLPTINSIPLDRNNLEKTIRQLQNTYYSTKGTVTSAIRHTLEEFNLVLLRQHDLALQQQASLETETGHAGIPITLAVLRITPSIPPTLFIAQCGQSQIIHISPTSVKRTYDPQRSGQGLGVSRSLPIHFLQLQAQAGDYLLWIPSLTIPWKAPLLQAIHGLALEKAHLQFFDKNNYDHLSANNRAILLQIQPGNGEIHIVKPQRIKTPAPNISDQAQPSARSAESEKLGRETTVAQEAPSAKPSQPIDSRGAAQSLSQPTEITSPIFQQGSAVPTETTPQPSTSPLEASAVNTQPIDDRTKKESAAETQTSSPSLQTPITEGERKTSAPTGNVQPQPQHQAEIKQPNVIQQLPFRALPESIKRLWINFLLLLYQKTKRQPQEKAASSFQLPSSVMVAIAVLVPIVVVAITSMVYLQRGITSLNEEYYLQAQSIAVKAIGEQNPQQKRRTIQESLALLDKAESYTVTEKSSALRDYLEALTDEIDGIIRIEFQPVLSGRLPANVDIKRIFLVGDDLYLFNAAQGNVLRAARTAQGFAIDPNFYCGPGSHVGPLVDVSPLTWSGDIKAALVGMDKNGQLLYCGGQKPFYQTLISPDKGWQEPKMIFAEFSRLYVLDTQANAIWVYSSKEENDFSEKPFFLFSTKAPKIQDVLSMTVYRGDIYLLHNDGHLTKCIYNFWYQTSTRCEERTAFTTVRSDESFYKIKRPDGNFAQLTQILYAPPPDPSIYLLDSETLSIYHLSLRLTIQQEYRAQKELTKNKRPASAFYIGPNRTVFLAIGNNVYYASLP